MSIPQNKKAEMDILSSLMISQDAASVVFDQLTDADFYYPNHQDVFKACYDLYQKGQPIDLVTVSSKLSAMKTLDRIGGDHFLSGLVERIPSAASVQHYCKLIMETSCARQSLAKIRNSVSELQTNPSQYKEVLEKLDIDLYRIMNRDNSNDMRPMRELITDAIGGIERAMETPDGITGVRSGFSKLDHMLAGFQPGDMIILAARPSMGKTALALNIAANAAMAGSPVGFISIEMTDVSLVNRILTSKSGLDGQAVRMGRLNQAQFSKLTDTANRLYDLNLMISDKANTLAKIRSAARRMYKRGAKLLILDYLQLVSHDTKYNENLKITEISQTLKAIAKEFRLPFLVLSQLSRPEKTIQPKRPTLLDLRGSGSIEQDADVVIFIHSDEGNDPSRAGENRQLYLDKQRNGPVGTIETRFDTKTMTFYQVEDRIPEPRDNSIF